MLGWTAVLTHDVSLPSVSAIMKIYALFTLHETGWGTRAGIGDRRSLFQSTRL